MLSDTREWEIPWELMQEVSLHLRACRTRMACNEIARWYLGLAIKGVQVGDLVIDDCSLPSFGVRRDRFRLGVECSRHSYAIPIEHLNRALGVGHGEWGSYLVVGFVANLIDKHLSAGWGPFDLVDFEWLMSNPLPSTKVSYHLTDQHGWFISVGSMAAPAPTTQTSHHAGTLMEVRDLA